MQRISLYMDDDNSAFTRAVWLLISVGGFIRTTERYDGLRRVIAVVPAKQYDAVLDAWLD